DEAGAKAARRAFELDESNADAHFFHAANLGSAERLRGIANAAVVLKDVMHCAMRAIELNPKHAQALQMMGGLLMELPWFLGGDEKKAQAYLERAIAADGNFTNARVLIAKLYKKQGRIDDAKQQLEAVIRAGNPHYRFAWERTYKPEAERMLKEIMEPAPLKREKLQLCSYSAARQTGGLLTGFYRQVQQKRPSQKLARGSFFIPPIGMQLSTLKIICLRGTRKDTAKPQKNRLSRFLLFREVLGQCAESYLVRVKRLKVVLKVL